MHLSCKGCDHFLTFWCTPKQDSCIPRITGGACIRLTDRRHMSDIVPFIWSQEQAQIKNKINEKPLSIVFDGTSRLGEAVAVTVRFIDPEWSFQQRLIRFCLLAISLSGAEIACELINTLAVQYSKASELVLAAMCDSVSSNGVAMCTLKVIYPSLIDIGCFSHSLDRVGENFPCEWVHYTLGESLQP